MVVRMEKDYLAVAENIAADHFREWLATVEVMTGHESALDQRPGAAATIRNAPPFWQNEIPLKNSVRSTVCTHP
jgi:hypothetical protein